MTGCTDIPKAPNITSTSVIDGGVPVSPPYRLTVGDEINVKFRFYSDLSDTAIIGPDGRVTLNLINDVPLSGLTLQEANERLNKQYKAILKEPEANVTVKTYALQQVFVTGQVANPGVQRSNIPLTASRAIALAGGFKASMAETHDVLLVRRAQDGSVLYYQIDLGDAGVGTASGQDPVLQSFDLVYVPETKIGEVADFVSNNITRILPYSASASASHAF